MRAAHEEASEAARLAGAARLRRLAGCQLDDSAVFTELANLLSAPLSDPASPSAAADATKPGAATPATRVEDPAGPAGISKPNLA